MFRIRFSLSCLGLIALALLALLVQPTNCRAKSSATWLDFSSTISPVFRPTDPFRWTLQSLICADSVVSDVVVERGGLAQPTLWWKVRRKPETGTGDGWASVRLSIPPQVIGKTSGMRIFVVSPTEAAIGVDAYQGAIAWRFTSSQRIGSKQIRLAKGLNDLQVLWRECGADPRAVDGIGLGVGGSFSQPFDLALIKIDLIFDEDADAKQFAEEPVRITTEWLASRGIDLRSQLGRVPTDILDRRCWAGVQLVAMKEQLDYWSRLLRKHAKKQDSTGVLLEKERSALAKNISAGKYVGPVLGRLQARVDDYVNRCIRTIPIASRRWFLGKDQRFHYPDGRPYRVYAPYWLRWEYSHTSPDLSIRPWDMRLLAAQGFTGVRLVMHYYALEPKRGQLDSRFIENVRAACREAERYGMAVSLDLHGPVPDWFRSGEPGLERVSNGSVVGTAQNFYQWQDALANTWGRVSSSLKDIPNIVGWEVPANEPSVVGGPEGIGVYPSLLKSWNDWLSRAYVFRDRLKEAWGTGPYALAADEDWTKGSIRWINVIGKSDIQVEYASNPRLWDHLRWVAWLQKDTTSKVMAAIRKYCPNAVGVMQRTTGDNWDGSPIPLNYLAISTIRGDHVIPGTHYGMASADALCAATQCLASYDSEQQMQNLEPMVRRHVELGLGFCPFMYSNYGYLHEPILLDDYGHMRADTMYLAKNADWIRTYWPKKQSACPRVAIVTNVRLEAVYQSRMGELVKMLQSRGCEVGLFNGLEVVEKPELLQSYKLVMTSSSYMDSELIATLDQHFKGKILLHGDLLKDALVRLPDTGLPAELVKRGLFVKNAGLSSLHLPGPERIDLSGEWKFKYMGILQEPGSRPLADDVTDWSTMPVPAYWDGSGAMPYTATKSLLGDGWYYRTVDIPAEWRGCTLMLKAGAIDDLDWTFFNGEMIGSTDESVPNAYNQPRNYSIPSKLIKWGKQNFIAVRVRNTAGDGGIWSGPVFITRMPLGDLKLDWKSNSSMNLAVSPGTVWLKRPDLRDDVKILAEFALGEQSAAGFVQQGRWFWFIGDSPWSESRPVDNTILDYIIRELNA